VDIPALISDRTRVVSVALFLPLLPLTIWMHHCADDVVWPSTDGKLVDVQTQLKHSPADSNGAPPRDYVEVQAIAEYEVNDTIYRRRQWPRDVYVAPFVDIEAIRISFLGDRVSICYDPDSPADAPPIHWRWWTAWLLTAASAGCLVPWLIEGLRRWAIRIDRPVQSQRHVLSGSEYRARL
jgi:hypothetical protein